MSFNLDEICICGDTYEVHFGGECTRILRSGKPCPCKEFASIEAGLDIYEALKALVASRGASTEFARAYVKAEAAIRKAKGE